MHQKYIRNASEIHQKYTRNRTGLRKLELFPPSPPPISLSVSLFKKKVHEK